MAQEQAAHNRPARLDPCAQFVAIGMGGIGIDPPYLRTDIDVLAGNAHAPGSIENDAAERPLRLKADKEDRRFPPMQVVLEMVADAPRLAHA